MNIHTQIQDCFDLHYRLVRITLEYYHQLIEKDRGCENMEEFSRFYITE